MSAPDACRVTLCTPAYDAEAFLSETLDAIQRQTYPAFKVLISVDRSSDRTAEIALRYTADPRFEVIVQEERLGFVANLNFLFDRVDTELFCYMQHDDVLGPATLETLVAILDRRPDGICAYCDIQRLGDAARVTALPSIEGTRIERVTAALGDGPVWVLLRALTRRTVLDDGVRLRLDANDGYQSAFLWALELAARGACLRDGSGRALYLKRLREASAGAAMRAAGRARILAGLHEHTVQTLQFIMGERFEADDRAGLAALLVERMRRRAREAAAASSHGADAEADFASLVGALVAAAAGGVPFAPDRIAGLADHPAVRAAAAASLLARGKAQASGGDPASAAIAAAAAADLVPGENASATLALARFRAGDFAASAEAARGGLGHAPRSGRLAGLLGRALARTGDDAGAATAFANAIACGEATAGNHCLMAHCLHRLGRNDEAVAAMEMAVGLAPGNEQYRRALELMRRAAT